jgi:hypothetical protein
LDRDLHSNDIYIRAWDPTVHAGSALRDLPTFQEIGHGDIVVELSPANDLDFWMRVVDAETGEPIAGAYNMEPIESGLPAEDPFRPTFGEWPKGCGGDGLLHFSGPAWARQTLHLIVPGHGSVVVEPQDGHELPDKAFLVTTGRNATIRLHVLDRAGLPVVDAAVGLGTNSNRQMRPIPDDPSIITFYSSWSARTDVNGLATIPDVPSDVPLLPSGSCFPSGKMRALVLKPGEVRDVEWVVDGGTLRGIVVDQANEPVVGCELWLKRTYCARPVYFDAQNCPSPDRRVKTDAAGRFVIAKVDGGKWWLGPGLVMTADATRVQDIAPFARVVEPLMGRSDVDLVLRVDRELFIKGRVLAPSGNERLDGTVVAQDRERGVSVSAPWRDDGVFVLGPLLRGRYELQATSASGNAPSTIANVESGASEVMLQLRAGASISGRVLDEQGQPVYGRVVLSSHDGRYAGTRTVQTSAEGEFRLRGLEPGRFGLTVAYGNRVAILDPVEVSEGSEVTDQVLRLIVGGTLRVRYMGHDRTCSASIEQDGVEVSSATLEFNQSYPLAAPAGKVTVRLHPCDTNEVLEREVVATPGSITNVVFDPSQH